MAVRVELALRVEDFEEHSLSATHVSARLLERRLVVAVRDEVGMGRRQLSGVDLESLPIEALGLVELSLVVKEKA